jgi:hypothetical protein
MMTKRLFSISAAVLMVIAAVSARAADGKLDVVVSIKPIHALVAGVMQGVATPHLLLNDQQSPHHFALKPSQARLLQQADLVFWVDSSLETPMQRSLQAWHRMPKIYGSWRILVWCYTRMQIRMAPMVMIMKVMMIKRNRIIMTTMRAMKIMTAMTAMTAMTGHIE